MRYCEKLENREILRNSVKKYIEEEGNEECWTVDWKDKWNFDPIDLVDRLRKHDSDSERE